VSNHEETNENWRTIYECAQDIAQHSDLVTWEVTSIMWGANTLLLGFILEAIDNRRAQPLILVISVIGIALSLYVSKVWELCKIGQRIGFATCRRIEESLPEDLRLHTQINAKYPPGAAQRWTFIITGIFLTAWIATFVEALILLCRNR
jgi:hypothetical protein